MKWILLYIAIGLIVFAIGYLACGLLMVLGTAWFAPQKLRAPGGGFRVGVAGALVFIWPVPAFIGFVRLITWPARRLMEKRLKALPEVNFATVGDDEDE